MKKFLHKLYLYMGGLAAFFLAAIAVLILCQIVMRAFGHHVPASDDLASWSMAASVFLALPYALFKNDHIRVSLILERLPIKVRQMFDIGTMVIAVGISGFCAVYAVLFVYDSYTFNDVSQGELTLPMWIPQLGMAVGFVVLHMAFWEKLCISCISGRNCTTNGLASDQHADMAIEEGGNHG